MERGVELLHREHGDERGDECENETHHQQAHAVWRAGIGRRLGRLENAKALAAAIDFHALGDLRFTEARQQRVVELLRGGVIA